MAWNWQTLVGDPKIFFCGDRVISFGTRLLFVGLAGDVSKVIVSSDLATFLMLSSLSSSVFMLLFARRRRSRAFGERPTIMSFDR